MSGKDISSYKIDINRKFQLLLEQLKLQQQLKLQPANYKINLCRTWGKYPATQYADILSNKPPTEATLHPDSMSTAHWHTLDSLGTQWRVMTWQKWSKQLVNIRHCVTQPLLWQKGRVKPELCSLSLKDKNRREGRGTQTGFFWLPLYVSDPVP